MSIWCCFCDIASKPLALVDVEMSTRYMCVKPKKRGNILKVILLLLLANMCYVRSETSQKIDVSDVFFMAFL